MSPELDTFTFERLWLHSRFYVCRGNALKVTFRLNQGWAITFLSGPVTDNKLVTGPEAPKSI